MPFAPAQTIEEFFADPQVLHNGTHFEVDDPKGGRIRYLRHPARYGASPASLRRHAPRLGEHTDEVLAEVGYAPPDIAQLHEEGAVV